MADAQNSPNNNKMGHRCPTCVTQYHSEPLLNNYIEVDHDNVPSYAISEQSDVPTSYKQHIMYNVRKDV